MIETVNLTKKYGNLTALDNLNLEIEAGTCYGFIGPNGAGKTTTIKILATLITPSWGEARVAGNVVGYQNPLIRPLIGYVPDFMGAYEDMLIQEYLEFFAACYGIHGRRRREVVDDVLELTELGYKRTSDVNGLSRGMKQRLSVARVLLHDPKVLLMDEPASGLDPRARIEIRELLRELHRMGKTIIISSHILSELAELCDAVGIIEQGKLLFSGDVAEAMKQAEVGQSVIVAVESRAEDAIKLLQAVPGITEVGIAPDQSEVAGTRLKVEVDPGKGLPASELASRLIAQGFRITELRREEVSLETAFMRLTRGMVS
ncbi:MAG: ABC transporter ATP-binding protein [Planctomycetota bacterium]|nr:ABC transporter ATP-binding protein [Planctomycetota bacterium]